MVLYYVDSIFITVIFVIMLVLKMSNIHMTRAFDKNGNIVSISDVKNGLQCNCFCIDCNTALIAKNKEGSKKIDHFAHVSNSQNIRECFWCPETEAHIIAKEIIREERSLEVPLGIINPKNILIDFDNVILETRVGNRIPDIIAYKDGEIIYIEIAVTHFCDIKKINEFKMLNRNCLEVDLSFFHTTSNTVQKKDVKKALSQAVKKWLSIAPCGTFAIRMHDHNKEEIRKTIDDFKSKNRALLEEFNIEKDKKAKEIRGLDDKIETLNQQYDFWRRRINPIESEILKKQAELRQLQEKINYLLPQVKNNEEKIYQIKSYNSIKEDLVSKINILQLDFDSKILEIQKLEVIIEEEKSHVQMIVSESGTTSERLTEKEQKLNEKEEALNKKERILSEKSFSLHNDIEEKAQKLAESRFLKLKEDNDRLIKEQENKLKDMRKQVDDFKRTHRSWFKFD